MKHPDKKVDVWFVVFHLLFRVAPMVAVAVVAVNQSH